MKRSRAFTLIELLVSLALIAILAALVLAAISEVNTSVNGAKCLTNLKTIGVAMRGYTEENNGYFPPHYNYAFFEASDLEKIRKLKWAWMSHLARYLGADEAGLYSNSPARAPMSSVFDCPADPNVKTWPKPRFYAPASPTETSQHLSSYGYNYHYLTTSQSWWNPRDWPVKANAIANPSRVILVTDGKAGGSDPIVVNPFSEVARPSLRHGSRFNAVFVDGHVESMAKEAAADQTYWRPQ